MREVRSFDMATFQATQNASKNLSEQNFERHRMNVLKEFIKFKPPIFEGDSDPLVAEEWLKMIKSMFNTTGVLKEYWVGFAIYLFEDSAEEWWDSKGDVFDIENLNWEEFETLFRETYVPETLRQDMIADLGRLAQKNTTISQYHDSFTKLSTYDPLMIADSVSRCDKFREGLKSSIKKRLEPFTFTNFNELVGAAQQVESYLVRKRMSRTQTVETKDKLQDHKMTIKSSKETCNDTCFLCGQVGHRFPSCPSNPSKSTPALGGNQSGSKDFETFLPGIICRKCKQEGHRKFTCPLNSLSTLSVMEPSREKSSSSKKEQLQGQPSAKDSGNVHSQADICNECGQVGHVKRDCPLKQLSTTPSAMEPLRDPSSFSVGGKLQGQTSNNDSGNVHTHSNKCHECGHVGHLKRDCPLKQQSSTPAMEPLRDPSSFSGGAQLQGQSGAKDSGNVHSKENMCHECGQSGHLKQNCPLNQLQSTPSTIEPLRDSSSYSVGRQSQGQSSAKDSGNVHSPDYICHECGQSGHLRRNCPLNQFLPSRDPSFSGGGELQCQSGGKDSGNMHSKVIICHECGQAGHIRRNCPLNQVQSTPSAMEPLRDSSSYSVGGQLQGQSSAKDSGNVQSEDYICYECGQAGHVRRNCPLLQFSPLRDGGGQSQGQSSAKDSGNVDSQDYACHECGEVGHLKRNCPLKQLPPLRDPSFSGGGQSQGQSSANDSVNVDSQDYICHECGQVGHIRRNCPLQQFPPLREPRFSGGGQSQGQSGAKDSCNVHSKAYICHECGQSGHLKNNCWLKKSTSTPSAPGPKRKKSSSSASGNKRFMPYPSHAFAQIGHEMSQHRAKKSQQQSQQGVKKKSSGQSSSASLRAKSKYTWFKPN